MKNILEMPDVMNVIRNAELQIKHLTGYRVELRPNVVGKAQSGIKVLLQDLICQFFNVSWQDIIGTRKHKDIADARKTYMFLAREILGQTSILTGNEVNRDHTTVLYAGYSMVNLMFVKDPISYKVNAIKARLNEHLSKA